ncbi:uncharacterized protein LOC143037282 [Oratosquilla oratoria]|uniref:uncharacterized protein LOC143037282 n=1 Tax=Oratosquilla oratoria TaxID=337810 RepID=UPI003F7776C1
MSSHSSPGREETLNDFTGAEFALRKKLVSLRNRINFLQDCLEEQVIPKSAPIHLQGGHLPFSKTARSYLLEAKETLLYEAEDYKGQLRHIQLPNHLLEKLSRSNQQQQANLQHKLSQLCNTSKWNNIGKHHLLNNLSSYTLTPSQSQALSLGLKFSTNNNTKKLSDYIMKNYNWKEDDIDIGFKQGVLFCCTLASKSNPPTIPRRFQVALEELRNNQDIVVTKADKGGGIVIMDKTEYIRKMEALLSDTNTYRPQTEQQAKDEANIFNKEARKLLRRTEKGKRLLHLLEENPRIPSMRGLPKTHKPEIPLRPITSGIGSAPHRLAKHLAKPLSSSLVGLVLVGTVEVTSRYALKDPESWVAKALLRGGVFRHKNMGLGLAQSPGN